MKDTRDAHKTVNLMLAWMRPAQRPLLGVKLTWRVLASTSANDPKQTLEACTPYDGSMGFGAAELSSQLEELFLHISLHIRGAHPEWA